MRTFDFKVYGTPAPQGSKRHVGNGRMIEMSKAVKPWREAVKTVALETFAGIPPMDGPVMVSLHFTLAKPASAPKKRATYPSKRPDLDKLIRSTFDAMGEAGVWKDDAQVIWVCGAKHYPNEDVAALHIPGVSVCVADAA